MQATTRVMLLVILFTAGVIGYAASQEQGALTYEKDVKPIISKRCLLCHGSNAPTIEEFNKDKEGFKQWLKVAAEKCEITEYQYGFINPENDELMIHQLDAATIEAII